MEILTNIALDLDTAALMDRVHVAADSDDAEAFTALIEQAREVARPKALYAEAFIEARGEDTVQVGKTTFTSRMLRKRLDGVQRVFPYVATCGREMDSVPLPPGDVLAQFWWDSIKAEVLTVARTHLLAHATERFRLKHTARMAPGSGDVDVWPIEQQRELFALLGGVTPAIGVVLTESCLMVPNKSVSGLLFATEEDFFTCQVCHRDPCPNRKAPFDEAVSSTLREA